MNVVYRILFLLFTTYGFAQDESSLMGKVYLGGKGLDSAYIINHSSKRMKLTDSTGSFRIRAIVGDAIEISHQNIKDSIIIVSDEIINSKHFIISIAGNVNSLDEAIVNYYPRINAVSLGIVQKKADPLSTRERRLRTAGDFKAIHLLSLLGGVLQTDPILNKINGKTKRLKKYIEHEKKLESMSLLKENYNRYMKEELGLSDEEIDKLIWYFVEDKNYSFLLKEGKEFKIKFYLRDCWSEIEDK